MDRRRFLRLMGMAGAAAAVPWSFDLKNFKFLVPRAYAFAQSPTNLQKFVLSLPGLGSSTANSIGQYLPVATPTTTTFMGVTTDVYHLTAKQYNQLMHPALPSTTRFRGYTDDAQPGVSKYLGPVIVAKKNRPVLVFMKNSLPNNNIIPTDPTIMATATKTCGQLGLWNRLVTHLHGGFTPWFSDGGPFAWFDPNGRVGSSLMNVPGTWPDAGTATYYYPNQQGARLMWYHDHAMGQTRTNAYIGLASAYLLTDDYETAIINQGDLPDLGIPLIIQDKSFVPQNILAQDPTWQYGGPGALWYPHVYEGESNTNYIPDFSVWPPVAPNDGKARWPYGPVTTPSNPSPMFAAPNPLPPKESIVPEGFFDTTMVNGAPYPVLAVTDKRFRFRILNASQARFWHLNLYVESSSIPGEPDLTKPGPAMWQIGTEGGWLTAPVQLPNGRPMPLAPGGAYPASTADPTGGATGFNLLLAPAERADVIIDFKGWAGASFILYNDAPSPFPGGDARNEYFTGNLDMSPYGGAPTTLAGFGPNTQTIMKITVQAGVQDKKSTATVINNLTADLKNAYVNGQQPGLIYTNGASKAVPGPVPYTGKVHRKLTLNEDFDDRGRLIQRLGTTDNLGLTTSDGLTINGLNNQGLPSWGRPYLDTATETPTKGAVEVWEIYNFTGDTHPIHFHLVNVQIIQRAQFDAVTPKFAPISGTERLPDANERGWKETVRMNPGEVTTVVARFDLPALPGAMGNPLSPRTGGHEYVWHCHILEHEEHDMMRPMIVF